MRAIQLRWVILATVFSEHVSRGAVPIVNLKEVKVAVGAVLQVKVRESNMQNLNRAHIKDPSILHNRNRITLTYADDSHVTPSSVLV